MPALGYDVKCIYYGLWSSLGKLLHSKLSKDQLFLVHLFNPVPNGSYTFSQCVACAKHDTYSLNPQSKDRVRLLQLVLHRMGNGG